MARIRVLLWSGDRAFRTTLRYALMARAFDVVPGSGQLFPASQPDVVILDIDTLPPVWRTSVRMMRRRDQFMGLIVVSADWPDFARLRA